MKSKNLFFFVFIFFINTMIHVYSEDYGYIVIGFEEQVSPKDKNNEGVLKFECSTSKCKISILNDFQDYSGFFPNVVDNAALIKTIDLSNFAITQIIHMECFMVVLDYKK